MNHIVRLPGKVPSVLRLIAKHGAQAFESKTVNGRYFGPLVSPRKAADVRKRALADGTFGNFSLPFGGWDPAWDTPRKIHAIKPNKGHLRERNRAERAAKITTALASMDDKYAKHQKETESKKPKKDLFFRFKRVASIHAKQQKETSHYTGNR